MSQRAFLDGLCNDIADAFDDVGLCDSGLYTPPVAEPEAPAVEPIVCRVFVDDGARQYGDQQTVVGSATAITFLRSEVPDPQRGGVIDVDGRRFTLDSPDIGLQTTAESRWWVTPELDDGD